VPAINNNFEITIWNKSDFYSSKITWTNLLGRSSSDQLFMSWEWMSCWWKVFSDESMQLAIVVVKVKNTDNVLGIAPMYLTNTRIKSFIKVKRLQFIGNCWRGKNTMRTELLDFIVDNNYQNEITTLLFEVLEKEFRWGECVMQDLPKSSVTYSNLIARDKNNNQMLRISDEFQNYYLPLNIEFNSYLQSLGKNTRKRIFNRRKVLSDIGDIKFYISKKADLDEAFKQLDRLHQIRWHKPIFGPSAFKFNIMLSSILAKLNGVQFSFITCNDRIVSVQYNFIVNNQKYNIQAGFDTHFNRKVSLGYLHFGYEIENSIDEGLDIYHLLAGEGKNTDYKEHLTSTGTDSINITIVRSPLLKILYYIYDQVMNVFR